MIFVFKNSYSSREGYLCIAGALMEFGVLHNHIADIYLDIKKTTDPNQYTYISPFFPYSTYPTPPTALIFLTSRVSAQNFKACTRKDETQPLLRTPRCCLRLGVRTRRLLSQQELPGLILARCNPRVEHKVDDLC